MEESNSDLREETHIPQVNQKHTAKILRPASVWEFLLSDEVRCDLIRLALHLLKKHL